MADLIKLTASDGSVVEFYNEISASGGMKDMYWCKGKKKLFFFLEIKLMPTQKID